MFSRVIKWHKIGRSATELLDGIPQNKPKSIQVAGKNLIVCKTINGQLAVLKDKCPHHGKKLSDGWCEDNKIVCPYHRFSFDLETGLGCGTGVDTYEVENRKDGVYIGVPTIRFL